MRVQHWFDITRFSLGKTKNRATFLLIPCVGMLISDLGACATKVDKSGDVFRWSLSWSSHGLWGILSIALSILFLIVVISSFN